MPRLIIALACLAIAGPARAESLLVPNGSFEDIAADGSSPAGWYAGEPGHAGYEVKVVRDEAAHGRASLMIRSGANGDSYASASRDMPPDRLAGRRVILSGDIRTRGLTGGRAGLWLRVYGPDGLLQSAGMEEGNILAGPAGTTPWQRYAISLTIDSRAVGIAYGVTMPGRGAAWFDDIRMEVSARRAAQE